MFQDERQKIEEALAAFFEAEGIPLAPLKWTSIPFNGEWGISTSFFQTAANEARSGKKVNVPQRAQELAEMAKTRLDGAEGFSRVEAVRGYLNLYFSTTEYARRVVRTAISLGKDFGRGEPKQTRIMVEYAQPNTHHSFHIGHYRNAMLGEALSRIVAFAGYDTLRAAYPGDLGLGVITVLWMYEKFYKGQEPEGIHERGQWLLNLYVEATKLLEPKENETPEEKAQREAYDAERREIYRKCDAGDPYICDLWRKTREWSLEELRDILRMLDIKIDVWFFESEMEDDAKAIVRELIEEGIAEDERPQGGAVIVKIDEKLGLKKEKYRSNVILRSDGTTLYLTKDLALAKIKFEKYGVDRSVYVVDVRQSLHLQQTFAILRLMGFPQAERCYHLGYGFVSLPGGAMSARRGRVVLFKEVADEALRRVLLEIEEKNPEMPENIREEIAMQVGLGALAYAMLSVENTRDIVFDMDAALSFEGRTGPYLQNAYVRASSILRKAEEAGVLPQEADSEFGWELLPSEIQLIETISRFPAAAEQAAEEYRPLVIANYAYDLASAFHRFYHAAPALQADSDAIRAGRLNLVRAARQTLENALHLLGIRTPEVM